MARKKKKKEAKVKIEWVQVGTLVYDFGIYPRHHYGDKIDENWVRDLRYVLRSGKQFHHPLIVDRKSKRVVDGFHRGHATEKENGPRGLIAVIYKTYKDDLEMLRESGLINKRHGKPMDRQDQIHYALVCQEHGMPASEISDILAMPEKKLLDFLDRRTALNEDGEAVALKRSAENMAGKTLTFQQEEAHQHLSGSSQVFLVNQIISILRTGLTNTANVRLIERLGDLQKELGQFFRKYKAG